MAAPTTSPRLFAFALFLLTSVILFPAHAQEIKDGFIVLQSGDYQYGSIQFVPTMNTYEECLFKADQKNEFKKFTPDQITGYGVINGIAYTTKEITIDGSVYKKFLRNEFDGTVKFYFYQNRFFVEKNDFLELRPTDYKSVLYQILSSCKSISKTLRYTEFDLSDLQDLFKRYQRCTNPEAVSESTSKFQFDLLGGIEINNSKLSSASTNPVKGEFSLTDKTLLSVGANAIIPFKNKKLAFVSGVYYYKQSFYAITRSVTANYSSIDKINLDYQELLIPITFQYSLFKRENIAMPYIKAGVLIPITFQSKFSWENEKEYTSAVYYEKYTIPQKFRQSPSLALTVGTTLNFIGNLNNVLEISYLNGSGKLKNSTNSFTVDSNRIILLFGIRF